MKKMTAMLLSLMMCFSLAALPAQAAFMPDSDNPIIIDAGTALDDDASTEPGDLIQMMRLPEPKDEMPTD